MSLKRLASLGGSDAPIVAERERERGEEEEEQIKETRVKNEVKKNLEVLYVVSL